MILTRSLLIQNKLGLHARAATKLATLARDYEAEVMISHGDKSASAGSVMSLLLLQTCQGQSVQVSAEGDDAAAALDAVENLINNFFDEGE
ncbi:HPr family phosphocarrier protein [Echinimonas agarilytica]|uniref:HPr family phosphocarrier protein n=1 Tax=Echinimonas agarilytica TaxID=1215918 RepID=A0AA42B6C7_9GAMM|nr:HPr family phosphocarrier protein [Echinimonas agarilytica]MCM2678607.1 HPr family phosphocarrier protein [Echinimonas agarilytica]